MLRALEKTLWEKKKKHFSPSPTVFSTLSKREIIILATFNLSSASALNLAMSKILSFGKELLSLALSHSELRFSTQKY